MMARKEKQKAESRQKLLISAAKCFAEKGYDQCTVADIARTAGMSQGSMYVHFKSKEELFKCMIQQEHGEAAAKMQQAAQEAPSFETIMTLLIKCVREVGYPIDHRLWIEILAVAARNESIREAFLESDRIMRNAFVSLIKQAARLGQVDPKLDFEAVSVWIYALVDGMIAREADDPSYDFEAQLKTFELLVRRALGAEPSKTTRQKK